MIATLLIEETGSNLAPSFYLIAVTVVGTLTLLTIRDRTGLPIDSGSAPAPLPILHQANRAKTRI